MKEMYSLSTKNKEKPILVLSNLNLSLYSKFTKTLKMKDLGTSDSSTSG